MTDTKGLPVVSQSPRDPLFVQDVYSTYARWHRDNPVFYWREYGLVAFAGYAAVDALLRDRRFGRQILHVATREELGWPERPAHLSNFDHVERYSLLELEPPAHTKLRRLVTKAFVSRQVETLRPQIRQTCEATLATLEKQGEAELLTTYAMQVPLITICNLLGVSISHGQQLLDWSHAIVRMYVLDPTIHEQHAADDAARAFADFLRAEIARKRKEPSDDLLSALIAVESQGDTLTIDELVSTCVVLLNAGHEATVHQFGNAIRTLLGVEVAMADPAKHFETVEATAATVEELVRFDAPLHMFTRYALDDVTLDVDGVSVSFRKGEQIALLLGAANRDPNAFVDVDAFLPDRDGQKNVTFGAGIHFCIGAPLARIELQEMLAILFARFPTLRLANEPRYGDVYHFHGLERLDVIW
ncbi:MAG: cytochrome P450 [Pseudomonadota bacterium]